MIQWNIPPSDTFIARHIELGPMLVTLSDDHAWYLNETWYIGDEGRCFHESDFDDIRMLPQP